MTIEQARAEIDCIKPKQDALWEQLKVKEAENKHLEDQWQALYTSQT
jgi:hypothetical protein